MYDYMTSFQANVDGANKILVQFRKLDMSKKGGGEDKEVVELATKILEESLDQWKYVITSFVLKVNMVL